jgi:DNA-binding transcriptional LysR family regulator
MKGATLRQIRVFCESARHLSFVRAAQTLHLSPPAVSIQIRELENLVGAPLFDRTARQVSLTPVGEHLLVYARRILVALKDAENAAALLRTGDAGHLTIGFVGTAKYFLMALIAEFLRAHPRVDIRLASGNRDHIVFLLDNNEADMVIMGRPPSGADKMRAEPFAAHPLVFVSAPDHPLAAQKRVSAADLAEYDLIGRETGSGTRAALHMFFEERKTPWTLRHTLPSNETIKQAVMAGLGLSFLSLHAIGHELSQNRLMILPVDGAPVLRSWNLVHVQSRPLSPAAQAFRYFMLENAQTRLADTFGHL